MVDFHGMSCQAVFLLQEGVFKVDCLGVLGRTLGEGLLEQIPSPLQLAATIPAHKVLEVRLPYLPRVGVLEDRQCPLVDPERVLPELILLRDGCRRVSSKCDQSVTGGIPGVSHLEEGQGGLLGLLGFRV